MTLIFCMEVDLDPSLDGIEGQGHRSKVKVKHENHVFQPSTRKGGQGQRSQRSGSRSQGQGRRSRSKVVGQGQRL